MSIDLSKFRVDNSGQSVGIFTNALPIHVDWDFVNELKQMAIDQTDKSIRLCLHDGPDALFHTMIIIQKKGSYYRPHKHREKSECFHIIEGSMAVVCFSDDGSVIDGRYLQSDQTFMYRVAENMYHTVIPITPIVVYHESKVGQFVKESDSTLAPWAPVGTDQTENDAYYETLVNQIKLEIK